MTAEVVNSSVVSNGEVQQKTNNNKKTWESERCRRRRKHKKKSHTNVNDTDNDSDDAKENTNPQQSVEQVEVEYVPEKADFGDNVPEEFKKVFEKFNFSDSTGGVLEDNDKKDEAVTAVKKKVDSDSDEEEEQDTNQKEKGGVSNKKKKLQRRMKIAELKH